MVKALHVTGFWSGNFYYRGYLPAMENEWLTSNDFIDAKPNNGKELVNKIDYVDVVQFQRPNNKHTLELMKLTKEKGKIVVFDDDDTFKIGIGIVPQNDEEMEHAIRVNKIRDEALKVADGATCTTEWLAKELREHNDNVCVLPNCIDPDDAGEVDPHDGRPRVLILGSVISNDDYVVAKKAIRQIADRVTFVLIGVPDNVEDLPSYKQDMEFWDSLPHVEKYGFRVFGDYYNTIQEVSPDIIIAPRSDNYFNRCKSNLKFLESSLFGIPFIGQAFEDGQSPYQVNPEDQKYLKLAQTEQDWIDALEDWLSNMPEYVKMGQQARDYVCEEYSIAKHAHKWEEFYKTLIK